MASVMDVLRLKASSEIYTVKPADKVLDAIRKMADHGVGALLVTENDALVGIVSERDYARKVILMARSSHTAEVREIMTTQVICVKPSDKVDHCLELMTDRRLRHLPVMDEGKLLGLVSIGDLVKKTIDDQKLLIEQLERYIRGEM